MALPYQVAGLTLSRGGNAQPELVSSLQHHLRALGYKGAGITGIFDVSTERAVRSLQVDLLKPTSRYNKVSGGARVTAVTGAVDQALAHCIAAMLADPDFEQLPVSASPANDNARALAAIRAHTNSVAP